MVKMRWLKERAAAESKQKGKKEVASPADEQPAIPAKEKSVKVKKAPPLRGKEKIEATRTKHHGINTPSDTGIPETPPAPEPPQTEE